MNIYENIYQVIETYIYGGDVSGSSEMQLVCILISTIGCIFVVALPFLVVWKVIKMIAG